MPDGVALDRILQPMIQDYLARNRAARAMQQALDAIGVGFFPLIDHLAIRTNHIDRRAREFTDLGFVYADTLEYSDWWAKVYRLPGYPALFVDQGYDDERGKTSVIPRWVAKFGDRGLHHAAVRVEDIEVTMDSLQAKGIRFAGEIIGSRGSTLRQIFTVPETVDGEPFTVLELTERHAGYQGFSPPQADSLMKSTVSRA
jgi:catechol 2,3-dioxygenase-like lactoylglutathione lyase family enzyme